MRLPDMAAVSRFEHLVDAFVPPTAVRAAVSLTAVN
jgi:hypothetical protein